MMLQTKRKLASAFCLCAMSILTSTVPRPVNAQSGVDNKDGQAWAAVAPGVVEPRSGQIKIAAPVIGRVSEVMVKINEKVAADELLLRVDARAGQSRSGACSASQD